MAARQAILRILVVDDEPLIRETLAEYLTGEGFAVETAATGEAALAAVAERSFAVVLCDVQLPRMDGLEVLERVRKTSPETFVLLITAYATVESAIEAFQQGAHDYLMKPIVLEEVRGKLKRLLAYREAVLDNAWLRRELSAQRDSGAMIGDSPGMRYAQTLIRRLAPTRSTVLILGESGTGKELVARDLHFTSPWRESKFLAINCAAIPADLLENQLFGRRKGAFTGADRDQAGLFEHAGNGTVFLDEIGEMPLGLQAKLLRAIEQKEVLPVGANEPIYLEARLLAATNKDLRKEVEQGRFREDLFYRLNVVTITVPPLRERREDIPDLVEHLVAKHSRALGKHFKGVEHQAMQILMACQWKGNVRELENALQRGVILGDGPLITAADLPPDLVPQPLQPSMVDDLSEAVRRFERLHIERMLKLHSDKKEAARRLGMGLSSLYRKIAELDIQVPGPREG